MTEQDARRAMREARGGILVEPRRWLFQYSQHVKRKGSDTVTVAVGWWDLSSGLFTALGGRTVTCPDAATAVALAKEQIAGLVGRPAGTGVYDRSAGDARPGGKAPARGTRGGRVMRKQILEDR